MIIALYLLMLALCATRAAYLATGDWCWYLVLPMVGLVALCVRFSVQPKGARR